jgi:5-carboxymethyl-2-hydroxymuconate isomerase
MEVQKNRSATNMKVLVAKCRERKRDEGKDTTFFHMGMEIPSGKLENFKKRKSTQTMEVVSPTAGTWYST